MRRGPWDPRAALEYTTEIDGAVTLWAPERAWLRERVAVQFEQHRRSNSTQEHWEPAPPFSSSATRRVGSRSDDVGSLSLSLTGNFTISRTGNTLLEVQTGPSNFRRLVARPLSAVERDNRLAAEEEMRSRERPGTALVQAGLRSSRENRNLEVEGQIQSTTPRAGWNRAIAWIREDPGELQEPDHMEEA